MQRDRQALFQHGIDLFNRGEFYRCHEVLEELWTPTIQPERWFLQSLIHFAVGFFHHQQSNQTGASRQLRKGLRKIQDYLPEWGGVRTAAIEQAVRDCLTSIEAGGRIKNYPKIEQVAGRQPE
jgi:predicted metal-dependent hydrolase